MTQKEYKFTLVINTGATAINKLEDDLFKSGCDDAIIYNFSKTKKTASIDFVRTGTDFKEVILNAIEQIQSAKCKPKVINLGLEDLVSASQIANRLNVTPQAVSLWRLGKRNNNFPSPILKLTAKYWLFSDVFNWWLLLPRKK
jgi:hypothetical protein